MEGRMVYPYPVDKFIMLSNNGTLTNDTPGTFLLAQGEYLSEEGTFIEIYPSDAKDFMFPEKYTHVLHIMKSVSI